MGQVPEWLKGRACKARGREAYRGSNPLLPITFISAVLLGEMNREGFEVSRDSAEGGTKVGPTLWEDR